MFKMSNDVDSKWVVDGCRAAFNSGKTRSYESRIAQLHSLRRMIGENKQAFVEAVKRDLRKPAYETLTFEVDFCENECITFINELKTWMKPEKVGMTFASVGKRVYIHRDPLGVILIIGAWNYPFQLIVHPLIGAIAAGNTAIVKPSEVSVATAKLFAELFPKYLDQDCFRVFNTGVQETTALLKHRFDHILYTGGGQVGSIIQAAAAKHLTPVTLELGGKSPLYIGADCKIEIAVRRAASARFYNAGQTCIAPDYIICQRSVTERLVATIKRVVREFYGDTPRLSEDYGRMVNARHFKRVCSLLEGQEIAMGGETDEADLYIAPTLLVNVKGTDKVMQEEIFGPVWPIINIESVDETIQFINSRDKPLALYIFTNDHRVFDRFQNETSSGAICHNECFVHGGVETLPFGGVGGSGMGCYHGKFTYDTFSHKKACLVDPAYTLSELARGLFYPPYTCRKMSIVAWALRRKLRSGRRSALVFLTIVAVVLAILYKVLFPWIPRN